LIVIGLETSMRMMEILSTRKEQVDPERRVIYIPKAKEPLQNSSTGYNESHRSLLQNGGVTSVL